MRDIVNKLLWVHFSANRRRQPCGFRQVQIKSVDVSKTTGELKTMTVGMFSPSAKGKFGGRRVKIFPDEWTGGACGILWYGKLRPVDEVTTKREQQ